MDVVAVSMPHYMRRKGLKLSEADTPDFVSASFSSPAATARKGVPKANFHLSGQSFIWIGLILS